VLSNYVPVLTDPVFLAGLGLFALGAFVPAADLLIHPHHANPALGNGVTAAGAVFLLAALCFALAWQAFPAGTNPLEHVDTLVWGAGHLLQIAYTGLLLTAWQSLGAQAFGTPPLGRGTWRLVCALLVIAAVPGPVLYMVHQGNPEALRGAFTQLYLYGLPVPVIAMTIATGVRIWHGPRDWRSPAFLGLALSLAQMLFAGLMGLFADGTDTRTPAHYHAEIGAVNLALIGLIFAQLLPALGRAGESSRASRLQFWIYGIGQAIASLGLFVAGAEGVGRKVAGAAQGLDTVTKKLAMGLAGGGGVVAVVGGVLFIWLALARLLARKPE
jgi:heme/copper-type cytochrome/quinol oxidase subunit 1